MNAQAPGEIELKFELDAADVPRLRSLLDARLGGSSRTTQLSSVYYDTMGQDLAAAGISLRVRSDERGGAVQTVKRSRGTQTALFQRDEWEVPLKAREPDYDAFARTPAGEVVAIERLAVAPVFETLIERTIWDVVKDGQKIEVALDNGRVVAGPRSEPMAELELELKQGTPRDLFHLIHDLAEIGSLRPGVLAKAERGYRLLRNKPHRATKAEPLHLTKAMTSAEAFQAVVHGCLRHFGLNVPLVTAQRMPEALHQARVALRRLRSALSLFKDLVADAEYPALKTDLQSLSRALGEARNLDVYLAESARPEGEREPHEPGLESFLAEMQRRRDAAYDDVVARLQSADFRRLLLRLLEWTEAGPWRTEVDPLRLAARDRPIRHYAAQMLEKRRRRIKRRGRHLAALDPHARHRVRIEAKKLRYASEFFAGLVRRPKILKRHELFIAALEELQEQLGALNDIQTGHEIALSFAAHQAGQAVPAEGAFPASHISGRQEAQTERLLEAAEAAHARLVAEKRFWSEWAA